MSGFAYRHGFTLIELILLIVVFFGFVGSFLSLGIEAARRVGDNRDASIAIQLAQDQAEIILADRRNPAVGYNLVTSGRYSDVSVPGFADYSRGVEITETDSTANPLCPPIAKTNAGCKRVMVTVRKNSKTLAAVTFILAEFH